MTAPHLTEHDDDDRRRVAEPEGSLTTMVGPLFALCAPDGDIDGGARHGQGLYFDDTRFLGRWVLLLGGVRPLTLEASLGADRTASVLTNPTMELADGTTLPGCSLLLRRERVLDGEAVETLRVRNLTQRQVELSVRLGFDSDFEDVFVVRGVPAGRRGTLRAPTWSDGCLLLGYDGADGRARRTSIAFDPAPSHVDGTTAGFDVSLPTGGETSITARVSVRDGVTTPARMDAHAFEPAAVETDNPGFDAALRRSLDDLRMLVTAQDGGRYVVAGVPWFAAMFGRDSIIAALQVLAYDPRLAASTLRALAARQGRVHDSRRGEEPGKILHELRVGEMAALGEIPHTPSYRTVDATPLFVILLAEQVRWSGDLELWRELRPCMERALAWIEGGGDHDGDGWLDYDGPVNQGWKDSGNCIVNVDGTLARPPIALVEVQAYAYRARLDAAWLLRLDGETEAAARLEADAADLRERFLRRFWLPHRACLALALQAGGVPVETLASNAGHALWAGILDAERAASVASAMVGDGLFGGWGVRTLSAHETAYNPLDYQVGAVWPHDNSLIAAGLKRSGHVDEAMTVFGAVFDAARHFPLSRLPELFAGLSRSEHPWPVRYPEACSPQAWAAGTLPYLLQTALGLEPDAPGRRLVVRQPTLPPWLGRVVWRGLRVGDGGADLRFVRADDGRVAVEALERRGGLDVVTLPAPP